MSNKEQQIKMGDKYTSGGSTTQYIQTDLGAQSLSVNTWADAEQIIKGEVLAKRIIASYNNLPLLLEAWKEISFMLKESVGDRVVYSTSLENHNRINDIISSIEKELSL